MSADYRAPETVDPQYRDKMEQLASGLDLIFNGSTDPAKRALGFFVCIFPIDSPGTFNYISNSPALEVGEMLDQIRARLHFPPTEGSA